MKDKVLDWNILKLKPNISTLILSILSHMQTGWCRLAEWTVSWNITDHLAADVMVKRQDFYHLCIGWLLERGHHQTQNGTPFSFIFLHLSFSLFLHCFCSLSLLSLNSIPAINGRCFLCMKISLYCLAMKHETPALCQLMSTADEMCLYWLHPRQLHINVSQKSNNVHSQTEFWVSNQNQFLSSHITWSIWFLIVLNRALMNVKRKTMMWWQARAHLLSAATHTHTSESHYAPVQISTPLRYYTVTMLPWCHDTTKDDSLINLILSLNKYAHQHIHKAIDRPFSAQLGPPPARSLLFFLLSHVWCAFIFELCMQTFWGPVIRLALALSLFGYAFKRRGALHIIEVCWASTFCFLSVSASSADLEAASSPRTLVLITFFFTVVSTSLL